MASVSVVFDTGFANSLPAYPGLRTVVLYFTRVDLGAQNFALTTLGITSAMQIVGINGVYHAANAIPAQAFYGINASAVGAAVTSTGTTLTLTCTSAPANCSAMLTLLVSQNSVV